MNGEETVPNTKKIIMCCDVCRRPFPDVAWKDRTAIEIECHHDGEYSARLPRGTRSSLRAESRNEALAEMSAARVDRAKRLVAVADQLMAKAVKRKTASRSIVEIAKELDWEAARGSLISIHDADVGAGEDWE